MPGTKRPIRKVDQAQRVFNRYIRKRDSDGDFFKCISCNETKPISEITAGHFISCSQTNLFRFCEDNVWGQCAHCNLKQNGNLANFRIALMKIIGTDRVLEMERQANDNSFKWTREQLSEIKRLYNEKTKELK